MLARYQAAYACFCCPILFLLDADFAVISQVETTMPSKQARKRECLPPVREDNEMPMDGYLARQERGTILGPKIQNQLSKKKGCRPKCAPRNSPCLPMPCLALPFCLTPSLTSTSALPRVPAQLLKSYSLF